MVVTRLEEGSGPLVFKGDSFSERPGTAEGMGRQVRERRERAPMGDRSFYHPWKNSSMHPLETYTRGCPDMCGKARNAQDHFPGPQEDSTWTQPACRLGGQCPRLRTDRPVE